MRRNDDPKDNRLLACLSDTDLDRLRPHMTWVDLKRGQVLQGPGLPQRHVHFPISAVIAKMCKLSSGETGGVAVVGSEGVVGMSLLLGGGGWPGYNEVLFAGRSVRVDASALRDVFRASASARRVLLLHLQALMTQIAQAVICYRFHTIEQRVCNLLLRTRDRLGCEDMVLTQELMANMLGVRRESVTHAVGHLRSVGVVGLSRGHIKVLDPAGLASRSCECHAVVKHEYERLLPSPLPRPVPFPRPLMPGPVWRSEVRPGVSA